MSGRVAVVAGATGLVGSYLWPMLVSHSDIWDRVILLSRRTLAALPEGVECYSVDFENLRSGLSGLQCDDLFWCLGSTIKKAGSQEAFARIDRDYALNTVSGLQLNGQLQHVLAVTAMGSDSRSRIFYNRTKGELEDALNQSSVPAVSLFRPSLLLGERKERRFLEGLGMGLGGPARSLMRGPLRPWAPIPAQCVALAMCREAQAYSIRAEKRPERLRHHRSVIRSDVMARRCNKLK